MSGLVVLVKHAQPILDATAPPREWRLGEEGMLQAIGLAADLRRFLPFRLSSSPEPKAIGTAEIVASQLSLTAEAVDGLEEFDRPTLPIVSDEQHALVNRPIFDDPTRRVLGRESGQDALARFDRALRELLVDTGDSNLVVISHGTVISLFVAAHNDVDGFDFWKRLECAAIVALHTESFMLVDPVESH